MNQTYYTTKKLFNHKENRDRFLTQPSVDYQLSKRGSRESQEPSTPLSKTFNQKLKELNSKENREMRLQCNLLESSSLNQCMGYNSGYSGVIERYRDNSVFRSIDEKAYKVLDAPGYSKDHFSHSIDTNKKGLLAALINNQVFLNSTSTGKTQKLVSNLSQINALKFMNRDEILVIGTSEGHIALYDLNKETSIIIRDQHRSSITSLDFTLSDCIISGGMDAKTRVFDIRQSKQGSSYDFFTESIYTVKSNPNNPFVFSAGESNGMLSVVDIRRDGPLYYKKEGDSGIRALTWHLNKRDLVYSAGLNAGELNCINTVSFERVNSHKLDTGVSDLLFSKVSNELLVALNSPSSCIEVRSAKCLTKIAELKGHTKPVLDLCYLKDTDIISGSVDQSLRFWNLSSGCNSILKEKAGEHREKRVKGRSYGLLIR